MKLHLSSSLRKAILACMFAATAPVFSASAGTSYLAEDVNPEDVFSCARFYDTGKGYYFSWDKSYWLDLYRVMARNGSFAFLGDLYERFSANTFDLNQESLTDDSDTCWAQVSMNLVEYWHSYYGVFCKDPRELIYGRCYDRQYLDETGGTLSLKQNLVFLDTFNNDGDNLVSYLDWMMLGYEEPWYSVIEQTGNGGYWKDYFTTNSHSIGCDLVDTVFPGDSISVLSSGLLRLLGYTRQADGSYTLTTKGQLVYLSVSPLGDGAGHAITCHGVELDDAGNLKALYVTNSDDMKYKLFKLYVKVVGGEICLYDNESCTRLWEYAGKGWYIDEARAIRTPEVLQGMLAEYESNNLKWSGSKSSWAMDPATKIAEALPDETSGWQVQVGEELYPSYHLDSDRVVEFDDTAASSTVTVSGVVKTAKMLLNNSELTYTFSGGQIAAGELVSSGGGHTVFKNVRMGGALLHLAAGTVELGSSAQLQYSSGTVDSGASLMFNGGEASITSLTLNSGAVIDLAGNGSLTTTTLTCSGEVTFLYSTAGARLTLGGSISASSPITLQMTDDAIMNEKYAIISFNDEMNNWESLFQSESGVLEYSGNTLYLTYIPYDQLYWNQAGGTWSADLWGDTAIPTKDILAYFDATPGGNVNISGKVEPYLVSIRGGNYTFSPADTSAALLIASDLNMTGSSVLTNNVPVEAESLTLSDSSRYVAGAASSFDFLNMGAGTSLSVASGVSLTFGQVNTMDGSISVESGGSLSLTSDADITPGGNLSGQGKVTLGGGVSYIFGESNLALSGQLELAADTRLETSGMLSASSVILKENSELSMSRADGFASTIKGSGSVSLEASTLSGHVDLATQAVFRNAAVKAALSGEGGVTVGGKVSLTGANSYTGGTTLDSATLTVGSSSALGSGKITSNGTSSITVSAGTSLTLQDAISNNGSLKLSGSFDVSSLATFDLAHTHINAEGVSGAYGFEMRNGFSVQVVTGGEVQVAGANAIHSGKALSMAEDGTASYFEDVDYSHYRTGSDEMVRLTSITEAAGGTATDIELSGGSLVMDGNAKGSLTLNTGNLIFEGQTVRIADSLLIETGLTSITLDGSYATGNTYTLLTANAISGNLENLDVIAANSGQLCELYVSGNALMIDIAREGATLVWSGGKKSAWQRDGGADWKKGAFSVKYADGDNVIFDTVGTITLAGNLKPGSITVNAEKNVTFKSDRKNPGSLSGAGDLTKTGRGTLTLNDGNTNWVGDIYVKEGTLKVTGNTSLGKGDVHLQGGTLNLASKAASNHIVQTGTAAIKNGKKFAGSYTLESGELRKGSVLNVAGSATLAGGLMNGTLSGNGQVLVTGNVTLGAAARITTPILTLGEEAALTIGSKGLSSAKTAISLADDALLTLGGKLNAQSLTLEGGSVKTDAAKAAAVTLKGNALLKDDATLSLNGKLSAVDLQMTDSTLRLSNAKPQSVTLKGNASLTNSSATINGKMSAASLTLVDSEVSLSDTKPQSLTVKKNLSLSSGSTLSLNGKLSAVDLQMTDSTLRLSNAKPQSVTLKGNATLTNSSATINGKMSAASLTLVDSEVSLSDTKPQSLTVKKNLSLSSGSTLSLNGKMSAVDLQMTDSTLRLSNAKSQSVTLKGNATLTNSSATINGKMSAANLTLNKSTMTLSGAKAQNLTVKQSLTLSSGSSLRLNGKLSAGSLTLNGGSSLMLSGSKPQTLAVKGALTLNSGSSIILDYDFVQGKTYKLLTFKSYSGSQEFYTLFGVNEDSCVFENTGKAITMTLTGDWNPQNPMVTNAEQEAPTPASALVTEELAPVSNPVADGLVQANWGQLEASRAFVNAISNRSSAVLLAGGERAVWASAIGGSSRHSSAHGHGGADTNISGGALGLETQVGRASLFGLALGNSWTRVSAHGFDTIKQDTTHLGIYGRTNWSKVSADWSAAYGRSESESMGSDWSQKHLQLDGRMSYNYALNADTVLSPFGGVQYYASDSATVDGVDTGSLQNLRAEIGVGANHRVGKLGVYGEVAVHRDLVRHNPKVSMGGLRFGGMNPGRTGLNFTVGASYELTEQWSVNASYTGEVVENANAHSANVGATYKF